MARKDYQTAVSAFRQANSQFDTQHAQDMTRPAHLMAAPTQANVIKAALLVPLAGAMFEQAEQQLAAGDHAEAMTTYASVFDSLGQAEAHLGGPDQILGTLYGSGTGRLFDIFQSLGLSQYGFSNMPRDILLPMYALTGLCHLRMYDHYPYRDIPVGQTPWPGHLQGSEVEQFQETVADAGPGIGPSRAGQSAGMRRDFQLDLARSCLKHAVDFSLQTDEAHEAGMANERFGPAAARVYLWLAALVDRTNREDPIHQDPFGAEATPESFLQEGLNRAQVYNQTFMAEGQPIDTSPFQNALRLAQENQPLSYLLGSDNVSGYLMTSPPRPR
ncbi:MAG: hypothetical protein KC476_01800 [Cyanobacteria bacterium HKST-UBA06]|nr:hypothetical protein [Cyanobacteria bacterium HKST-UBA06]